MEQETARILPIRTHHVSNSAIIARIPAPLTSFVGREHEVVDVSELLQEDSVRFLTLTGPGGVGKTRLSIEVAQQVLPNFPDGVFFVPFAAIRDPELILSHIVSTLELDEPGDLSAYEHLTTRLRHASLLFVLDNFEHLSMAASLLVDLLHACPSFKVLITSRTVLRVEGEHTFEVLPFTSPDDKRNETMEQLTYYPAIQLFVQRAQALKADFSLTEANCHSIAAICACLDGLPLAIELAAARINLLPPQTLLKRLQSRLSLLTTGMQDVHWRQQTLRNTLQWSYDLLDQQEQRIFRLLAVFAGGCTLEAVEALADSGGYGVENAMDVVSSLVDKSLLFQREQPDGEPRLFMLETIHEYATACLSESGEADNRYLKHVEYFLALAEEAESKLAGAEQFTWLERLEQEHDNLRAALNWLIASKKMELALRLESALFPFWTMHSHMNEGHIWLEKALTNNREVPVTVRAKALFAAGSFSFFRGDNSRAATLFEECLKLFRELGERGGIIFALNGVGHVAITQHRYALVQRVGEENLLLAREAGDRWKVTEALFFLAYGYLAQGDYARARAAGEECLANARDFAEPTCLAHSIHTVGRVAYKQNDLAVAYAHYQESIALAIEINEQWLISACLVGLGEVAAAQGELVWAAHLWGAEEALHEIIQARRLYLARAPDEESVVNARIRLGKEAFAAAWDEGRNMPLKDALTASEASPSPSISHAEPLYLVKTFPTTAEASNDLTDRELEVLRLLAQGLSDVQIAEQLIISPRTVNTHVTSIYRKLHVTTRSAATRYAVDHRLV